MEARDVVERYARAGGADPSGCRCGGLVLRPIPLEFLRDAIRYDDAEGTCYVDKDSDGAVVWSHSRSGYVSADEFALEDDLDGLFDVHPHNVFLIKVNHWFNI